MVSVTLNPTFTSFLSQHPDKNHMFDWVGFLEARGIEYQTAGSNVSAGNISIHCPYCGPADPSFHLSISLQGRGWRCWREHAHRGRSPVRLVATLANCSQDMAASIVGVERHLPEDFLTKVNTTLSPVQGNPDRPALSLPEEFRQFDKSKPSCRPFLNYMRQRGYALSTILRITERFKVFTCTQGPFFSRIIFLVEYDGKLVSWTGRAIGRQLPRYKTLTTNPEKSDGGPLAHGPISNYLLWYDQIKGVRWAHTLILCEGPFDALRVATLGQFQGVVATCFFTMVPSPAQVALLHDLAPKFKRVLLLLDQGTTPAALSLRSRLAPLPIGVKQLPPGVKDPADLDAKTFDLIMGQRGL